MPDPDPATPLQVATGRETAGNAYALSPEQAAAYEAGRASERQRIAGGMVAGAIEMGYTEFGGFWLAWPHLQATYAELVAEPDADLLDGDGDA